MSHKTLTCNKGEAGDIEKRCGERWGWGVERKEGERCSERKLGEAVRKGRRKWGKEKTF